MDLKGSLVNTSLKIYPTNNLINYFNSLQIDDEVPVNIIKFVKRNDYKIKQKDSKEDIKTIPIHLNSTDVKNLIKIRGAIKIEKEEAIDLDNVSKKENIKDTNSKGDYKKIKNIIGKENIPKDMGEGDTVKTKLHEDANEKIKTIKDDYKGKKGASNGETKKSKEDCNEKIKNESTGKENNLHLTTSDIDWLYGHLQKQRSNGEKDVPYLHVLLEGVQIATPDNKIIKRNPILEARCVKLRAQQEAREYRKMTKSVDNVRMRFPEDSISYQLKQVNRQLIAIGQFIISIFAGFLFGFKGVEWMIGELDFGFRLLLGVMCALIIALAEIYFLAKKLNEELNIPETIQLGGPPKFVDQQTYFIPKVPKKTVDKEHKD